MFCVFTSYSFDEKNRYLFNNFCAALLRVCVLLFVSNILRPVPVTIMYFNGILDNIISLGSRSFSNVISQLLLSEVT